MDYFPLALATGKAFCNRITEQQILKHNLLESRPSLIISPRRYGKTSLALHVLQQTKLNHVQFDFLSAINTLDIEKIILKGVGQMISRIERGPRKALKIATELFAGLSIKLSFDQLGLSLEINKSSQDPATNILNILERIEALSKRYNKKLVLFFDEFQRIYEISENQAIESIIRQIAQSSKQLAFIFSGSNRHLLHQVFNDRNRPFYKLCDRITLDRINAKDYTHYIQDAAQQTWKQMLAENVINQIFYFSERHPYYINLLCSRLWRKSKITVATVNEIWESYLLEERSNVGSELDLLSANQRKLLVVLARHDGIKEPRSKEFQMLSGMPGTSITQSLKFLEQKDYIYLDKEKGYRVLDPMLKSVLSDHHL